MTQMMGQDERREIKKQKENKITKTRIYGRRGGSKSRNLRVQIQKGQVKRKRDQSDSHRACFCCGSNDHMVRDCSEKSRGVKCFNCQGYGHISAQCPKSQGLLELSAEGEWVRDMKGIATTSGKASAMTLHGLQDTPTGSIPRSSFPGYLSSETSVLTSHHLSLTSHPGAYGLDDITGIGMRTEPGFGGLTGASIRGYPPPLQDPILPGQRPDVAVAIGSGIPDLINGRPVSLAKVDAPPVPARESNILFVDGLPSDSSRREVGHLFRPFIGFKDIRVVHKEPRRIGDKAMVLCFVEFDDAKCALTALEALQGYKFDDKKSDSFVLRIHFAHFPFRLPSDCGEQWS